MVISDCPTLLLGRDILTKANAQISFIPQGVEVSSPTATVTGTAVLKLALVDEHRLFEEAHTQKLIKEGEQPAENESICPDLPKAGVLLQ